MLEGKCVCEGYAKILQQVLKSSGIDCKYISGIGRDWWDLEKTEDGEAHGWNQVKIDGQWYNCDLTWDAGRIKENRPLEYCLQSDEEFILHETDSTEKQTCSESYDRNKVNSYLGYTTALEFEEKEYATSDLLKLIKDMEQCSENGLRMSIQQDIATRNYYMSIGNIINDDEVRWSDNKIMFENMDDFIQQYIAEFPTQEVNKRRNYKFYKK